MSYTFLTPSTTQANIEPPQDMFYKFYSDQMRRNVFKYGRDRKLNSKFGKKMLSLYNRNFRLEK